MGRHFSTIYISHQSSEKKQCELNTFYFCFYTPSVKSSLFTIFAYINKNTVVKINFSKTDRHMVPVNDFCGRSPITRAPIHIYRCYKFAFNLLQVYRSYAFGSPSCTFSEMSFSRQNLFACFVIIEHSNWSKCRFIV